MVVDLDNTQSQKDDNDDENDDKYDNDDEEDDEDKNGHNLANFYGTRSRFSEVKDLDNT